MAITVYLHYHGVNGNARLFAQEMMDTGVVEAIRSTPGNLRYEYFIPFDDPETVMLIDAWQNQKAIDRHHASPMMETISLLREKYDLHMNVERYHYEEADLAEEDKDFIRK